jgi:hypothetical protein
VSSFVMRVLLLPFLVYQGLLGIFDSNHAIMPAELMVSYTAATPPMLLPDPFSSNSNHRASPPAMTQNQDDNEWTSDDTSKNLGVSNGNDHDNDDHDNDDDDDDKNTQRNGEASSFLCVILFGAWAVLCFVVSMAVWAMAFESLPPLVTTIATTMTPTREENVENNLYYHLPDEDQMLI